MVDRFEKDGIQLADYDYQRDIVHRKLMSQLSVFDVEVLDEVIHHSLRFSVDELSEDLEAPVGDVLLSLEQFAEVGLLTLDHNDVTVDKPLRKYYLRQIEKFADGFVPDLNYLLTCLNKLPIEVLPQWYSVPRSSDDIFASVIENYLSTVKRYDRYLKQLKFSNPVLDGIVKEVFSAPDWTVRSRDLKERFNLNQEEFEEAMLFLEYSFVCFLSYRKIDGMWKEVVTPLYEWHQYLRHLSVTQPTSITNQSALQLLCEGEFSFVREMDAMLKEADQAPLSIHEEEGCYIISESSHKSNLASREYLDRVLKKLISLQYASIEEGRLTPTKDGREWGTRDTQHKAIDLYRHPLNQLSAQEAVTEVQCDRSIRQVEKSLRRVMSSGWVYLDDFLLAVVHPLDRTTNGLTLQRKKKRWEYVIPSYSEGESSFIQATICERLYESGIVDLGTHDGKVCFTATPFGRLAIGE